MNSRWIPGVLMLAATVAWSAALPQERTRLEGLNAEVRRIREAQFALRADLQARSSEIAALKALPKGQRDAGALTQALRASQALADRLSALAQEMSQKEGGLEVARESVLAALAEEFQRLQAAYDREPSRAQRSQLIQSLRALRSEREQLRSQLGSSGHTRLPEWAPAAEVEDVLEQLDFVRDEEDKVQKEMRAIEVRLKEAAQDEALDERLRHFASDDALFDESDRRLRFSESRSSRPAASATGDPKASPPAVPLASSPPLGNAAPGEPPAGVGQNPSPSSEGSADFGGSKAEVAPVESSVRSVRANDYRPEVGGASRPTSGLAPEGSVSALKRERERLRRLSDQLRMRATSLEQRSQKK